MGSKANIALARVSAAPPASTPDDLSDSVGSKHHFLVDRDRDTLTPG